MSTSSQININKSVTVLNPMKPNFTELGTAEPHLLVFFVGKWKWKCCRPFYWPWTASWEKKYYNGWLGKTKNLDVSDFLFLWKSLHVLSQFTTLGQSLQNYLLIQQRSTWKDVEVGISDFSCWNFRYTYEWSIEWFSIL